MLSSGPRRVAPVGLMVDSAASYEPVQERLYALKSTSQCTLPLSSAVSVPRVKNSPSSSRRLPVTGPANKSGDQEPVMSAPGGSLSDLGWPISRPIGRSAGRAGRRLWVEDPQHVGSSCTARENESYHERTGQDAPRAALLAARLCRCLPAGRRHGDGRWRWRGNGLLFEPAVHGTARRSLLT